MTVHAPPLRAGGWKHPRYYLWLRCKRSRGASARDRQRSAIPAHRRLAATRCALDYRSRPSAACGGLKHPRYFGCRCRVSKIHVIDEIHGGICTDSPCSATFALSGDEGATSFGFGEKRCFFHLLTNPRKAMNIRSRSARAASGGLRFLPRALRPAPSRNATWLAVAALGLASLLGPAKADGQIVVAHSPFLDSNNNVALNVSAQNDNIGAIYNSAELNVFRDLAAQLYALPENQTNYNSIADLMSDWNVFIDPTGDVSLGWNYQKQNDGSISLSNIGGRAGSDYDEWTSNPGSNTQLYTITIPNSQLNFDGVAGYDPAKAGIVLSSVEQPNMFQATTTGGFNIQADGLSYQLVIPEPKTYALLFGLIAGGAAILRRRRRSVVASR
jgi:hypothetical protein